VGAHLLAQARLNRGGVLYWRTKIHGLDVEVDYVTVRGGEITAIEVKGGATIGSLKGLAAFREAFGPQARTQLVGTGGVSLDEFLCTSDE
jgi:predicted RecB family endonuclease